MTERLKQLRAGRIFAPHHVNPQISEILLQQLTRLQHAQIAKPLVANAQFALTRRGGKQLSSLAPLLDDAQMRQLRAQRMAADAKQLCGLALVILALTHCRLNHGAQHTVVQRAAVGQ